MKIFIIIFSLLFGGLFAISNETINSELMLASILRSAPSGVGVVHNRVITNVNDYIVNLLGYSREELVGQSARILYPSQEEYEYVGKEKYRQIYEKGTGSVETLWKRKDGKLLNVLLSSTPLDTNDLSVGVVFTVLDITERKHASVLLEKRTNIFLVSLAILVFLQLIFIIVLVRSLRRRKQAEESLLAKSKELDQFFNSALDLLCIADKKGSFIRLNKEWENTLGYKIADLEKRKFLDFVHPDDIDATLNAVSMLGDNQEVLNFTNRYKCKDGSYRLIEWRSSPHGDFIYAAARDITERKKAEEERLANEQQFNRIQKLESLGILAGGIAHDFNNLLGGIFGYIDLAYQKTSEDNIAKYLSNAVNTIDRARGLTRQLLTFARGGAPIKKTDSLMPFLEETARFAFSGSNTACVFDIDSDLRMCSYDKAQIAQVIDNVVINAQQSMPDGGTVTITAKNVIVDSLVNQTLTPGCYVRISVADTGIGIPEKILPRIFDPFFTTKEKGHGLGLSTSYSIIKRHGGSIDVESEAGKGSVFHLYLPAEENSVIANKNVTSKEHKGNGIFLVMDDEEVLRNMVGDMLESFGYGVVKKNNGTDAIAFFKSEIDAGRKLSGMIFDLTIPGNMGGKEAIYEVRKICQKTPVFVASGYADDPVVATPSNFGFTASICKPFKSTELADLLNKYIG